MSAYSVAEEFDDSETVCGAIIRARVVGCQNSSRASAITPVIAPALVLSVID